MASKQELIARDLALKIRHHFYPVGDYLPSENQLTELYGTSRETIRNALSILMDMGMIQKIRGKGSIVLDFERFTLPISGMTSFQELNARLGMEAETKMMVCKAIHHLPDYFIKRGAKEGTATYVERLRIVDDIPSVVDCDYLLSPPIPVIENIADASSLYHYVEKTLGLEIGYATKEITVEKPSESIRKYLGLDCDNVVVVRSLSYLSDTTLFQLTESYHRPDKFKFADFARRKKIDL